jgi:PAS domain S-box-containing protein
MSEVAPETVQKPEATAPIDKLVEVISRSQHNYRELIDSLDQAVFTLSPAGEIRVANRLFAQILGAEFHDLIGHSLSEFVAAPAIAELKSLLPALLGKGSWQGDASIRLAKETNARIFRCWLQAIVGSEGLVSVIGWARDITAEQDRESTFTGFFESLDEGLFISTPDGQILEANPAFVRLFGYDSKEELLKVNFRNLYDSVSEREEIVRTLRETGILTDREIEYVRKDGKRFWCRGRGYAVHDASGRVLRMHGLLTDITERREIKRRLREERQFVQRLIDSYPDGILVLDCTGQFIYANRRIKDLAGRDPESYIGRRLGPDIHPEDAARVRHHFEDFIAGKDTPPEIEYRVRHQDGGWRMLRTAIAAMKDESGQVTAVVASTRDITQQRAAERLTVEKEKFAAMGHMLTGAAHELNNPLTAILGVADLLRARASDDTTRRHADLVLQQARRAAGIIQGLLAFSRHSPQGWANLHLSDLLMQIVEAKKRTPGNGIEFYLRMDSNLPEITGDAKLLAQVFQNIITNAEQSIGSGRGSGSIKISAESIGASICVSFTDDGPGIAAENLGKIFDPFFTTKRPGGGSGLGLTIALAVAKEHGGEIKAGAGAGDTGACLRVILPVAGVSAISAPAPKEGRQARGTAANGLAGHSVLVVDDEESIREIACEGLAAKGMTVHEAATADAAFDFFASRDCDVVLCDFNLNGAKGEVIFDKLRALRPSNMPRFIFMTGALVDSESVARFEGMGARLLQKPFPVSVLASLVGEVLQVQSTVTK